MKKRRDITLGDLKAGCKRTAQNDIKACDKCEFSAVCSDMGFGIAPAFWKLADPPRFNEAQMAFWRGWYEIGARWVKRRVGTACVDFSLTTLDFCASYSCVLPNQIANELEEGKAYDLAKLLGKDGKE